MSRQPSPCPGPAWLTWVVVLIASACGLAAAVALAQGHLPLGRADIWTWKPREEVLGLLPWKAVAGAGLLVITLIVFDALRGAKPPSRPFTALLLIALTIASASLMVATIADEREYPFRAAAAVLGDLSMGYYLQARQIQDPRAYIADTARRTRLGAAPERVVTHPPGPVLFAWGTRRLFTSHPELLRGCRLRLEVWSGDNGLAAMLQLVRRVCTRPMTTDDLVIALFPMLALTLASCLVVPATFLMAVAVADRRLALAAAALAAAIPSLVAFSPSIDGWIAVVGAAIVACGSAALRRRSLVLAALTGILLAYGCFWSFGVSALLAVLGILMLLSLPRASGPRLPVAIAAAAGFAAASLVLWAFLRYDPLASFLASMQAQSQIMAQNHRPYLASIPWNLYDFALFAGPALVVLALCATLFGARSSSPWRGAALLGASTILTVLLLALAGSTRGEVGRIWALMMPLLVPAAASPLFSLRGWGLISAGVLVVASQVALTLTINGHLALVSP